MTLLSFETEKHVWNVTSAMRFSVYTAAVGWLEL